MVGILHYQTLESFGQEYRPGPGYPLILLRKEHDGYQVVLTQLAYASYAFAYRKKTQYGNYIGRVLVCDDLERLYLLYKNF